MEWSQEDFEEVNLPSHELQKAEEVNIHIKLAGIYIATQALLYVSMSMQHALTCQIFMEDSRAELVAVVVEEVDIFTCFVIGAARLKGHRHIRMHCNISSHSVKTLSRLILTP